MSSHLPHHAQPRRSGRVVPTAVATVLLILGAATFVILTRGHDDPEPGLEIPGLNPAAPAVPPSIPPGKLIEKAKEPNGSDFVRPGDTLSVTIRATDHAFLSAGCGSWSTSQPFPVRLRAALAARSRSSATPGRSARVRA
ncbi:hypothetical protein KZ829_33720 [Actinoplanes hulinensis]|uniref:Uncharacterized protein n=1 Tax=Actinoplanes hulinensis TaxID=1144547 RepID=A0ABS7BE10_9ACTN|nr:hypothetical protein [Actinoplanes hulinensis]MBW6438698.1 hypothetical protein [Actinoplanes hulinensis]